MNSAIVMLMQSTSTVFSWLGTWLAACVIGGTFLAIATWIIVRLAGKRLPASLIFALWLIVLVKFLAPIGPGWGYSLASLTAAARPHWVNTAATNPVANSSDGEITHLIPVGTRIDAPASGDSAGRGILSNWPQALLLVYLAGAVGFGMRRWLAHRRLKRLVTSFPSATDEIVRLVNRVCERHQIGPAVRVKISPMAPAPYILGFLRPTLVLSPRQLSDRNELEAVVLHEIAHLRRADWLARCLQTLVGTLLFFWPVVAWVNRRIDLARELSCDEWALRHGRLSAGQYARCLLRAVQPLTAAAQAACPTAMAANARHVERRIEMILQNNSSGRPSRMVGLLAGTAVLGWAGFVLAGPQQEKRVVVQTDDSAAGKKVIVINNDDTGSGSEEHMIFLSSDGQTFIPDGDTIFWNSEETDGAGGQTRSMIALRGNSAKALAQFAKDHPTADANGDGVVTQAEYNAYITALAINDPAKVIAQFPDADRNGDGKLDTNEAARLVVAPPKMPVFARTMASGAESKWVGGPDKAGAGAGENVQVNVTATGTDPDKHVMVIRKTDANGTTTEQTLTGDDAKMQVLPFNEKISMPAGPWILKNVNATPAAADVSKLVPIVESTDLAIFLEMNPKADRNGDGVLTSAERDAYVAENMSVMRQKFLEKHPAADANGDGVLTQEEMHAFMKANGPAMSSDLHSKLGANVTVKDGKVFVDGKEVSTEDGNVKVIRVDKNAGGGGK